jgi:MinD superfamily P-loop ATPase
MRLTIDKEACDRCGTCISVCPCNALVLADTLDVDTKTCTGCGTCVNICPVGALALQ